MRVLYAHILLSGLCAVSIPPAASAAADAGEFETLSEVIVTAQKRSESVQAVPVSITVVDEKQLERQGVTSVVDLSKASASLEFGAPSRSPGGGGIMRGIGTVSFNASAQGSVGLVVDGVVTNGAYTTSLFDLERVEVLKGPQGTLFGSAVSAGVINMSTKRPRLGIRSFDFSSEYADKNAGSDFTHGMVRGVLNLPFGETSALRVALHSDQTVGVFRNVWQQKDGSEHDNGMRVRYLWQPSDRVTLNVIGEYDDLSQWDIPAVVYQSAPAGSGVANALNACGVTPSESNSDFCSDTHLQTRNVTRAISAQVDVGVAENTFTVVGSTRYKDTQSHGDIITIPGSITSAYFLPFPPVNCQCVPIFEIGPGGYPGNPQTTGHRVNTLEARLTSAAGRPVEWVAGLYGETGAIDYANPGFIRALFIANGAIRAPTGTWGNVEKREYAGFGNLTWHINKSRMILGARYTKSSAQESEYDISNVTPAFPGYRTSPKYSESQFNYRFGVQYDFNDRLMGYATVSSGYKGPQISDNFSNGTTFFEVKPEVPTSYEIGLKSSLLDNRLAVNADVFYNNVKNYQGQNCSPNSTGTITCVPTNVSEVISQGVEVEVFGRPTEHWTVNASASYNPAKYPNGYRDEFGLDLGGTQVTYSPREKVTASAEYSWPVSASYTVSVGADGTYRGKISMYPANYAIFEVGSSVIANLRVALKSSRNWDLALFARNVGRENYPRELYPPPFSEIKDASGRLVQTALWHVFDANTKRVIGLQFNAHFGGST